MAEIFAYKLEDQPQQSEAEQSTEAALFLLVQALHHVSIAGVHPHYTSAGVTATATHYCPADREPGEGAVSRREARRRRRSSGGG